jgi:hypothetical protein
MSGITKAPKSKKMPQLAGPGPSVPPGGVMVAPEPKADGVSAAPTVEPTLMGMIASLSPWAEAREAPRAAPGVSCLPARRPRPSQPRPRRIAGHALMRRPPAATGDDGRLGGGRPAVRGRKA